MTIRIHLCRPYEIAYLEPSSVSSEKCQPIWLEQYTALREECFQQSLGIKNLSTSFDRYDLSGYLLLVINDGVCVGGARLNEACSGGKYGGERLPLESDSFMLNRVFPQLNREGVRYGQWTRLVLDESFRTPSVLNMLATAMADLSVQRDHQYCFNVSGTERARLYRRLHLSQGYRCEIRREVTIPVEDGFGHLEHLLSVAYSRTSTSPLIYQPYESEDIAEEAVA